MLQVLVPVSGPCVHAHHVRHNGNFAVIEADCRFQRQASRNETHNRREGERRSFLSIRHRGVDSGEGSGASRWAVRDMGRSSVPKVRVVAWCASHRCSATVPRSRARLTWAALTRNYLAYTRCCWRTPIATEVSLRLGAITCVLARTMRCVMLPRSTILFVVVNDSLVLSRKSCLERGEEA